ncbi:response regulator [Caenimonas koreensis DSM 17982]|uniref:histidine kinase n=2 Tax=Caenimonas TaxID=763439 RepID=A0A844AXD7_9BURK|nr:response regulator [Caenimonas koreensis DSM 17982]
MVSCFPCQHPDRVRIAQSIAAVQESTSTAALIASMMALGLVAQLQQGFGFTALAWQIVMGTFACVTLAGPTRVRRLAPPTSVSPRQIRIWTICAAIVGSCWALGMLGWALHAPQQLVLVAIAVSVTYTVHAVASCFFAPVAVLAFAAPLLAAATAAALLTLDGSVRQITLVLIAIHAWAAMRLLMKNWTRFAQLIDREVDRGRLSSMLHEQKEIAERAVHLKTRFLASASHDLRQPMHAISLYLDGLAELDLPENIRPVINDARVCAHDMNDMFRSLLDMSRLDAQQAVPTLSTFSIGPVMSRVEKEFSPLASSRGVRLKVRPCTDHVYSDPVMVERIALNFVSNAVRHTTSGRILVACRVRGRSLRLAVYDTGRGIPQSEQQAIFEEFRQLDAPQTRDPSGGGLGLGLAIVRRLAQALRLPVTVRSTPGRGSMFAVDLPLVHVSRAGPQPLSATSRLAGRLVVIVDDEPSILLAATFILQTAGCTVISARSSDEAMKSLTGSVRVPDFIICDYELHDSHNGADVIRMLREEFNHDIPALLVTGNTAGGEAGESAMELGIKVLHKPLEASVLKQSLEELLANEGAMK